MFSSIFLKSYTTSPLLRLTYASLSLLPFPILGAKETLQPQIIRQTIEELMNSGSSTQKLAEDKGLSIVLFYRAGCPYCRSFLPIFQKLAVMCQSQSVTFRQVRFSDDYDLRAQQKKDLEHQYQIGINTFPCIAIFKDGARKLLLQGDQKEREFDRLTQLIRRYLDK